MKKLLFTFSLLIFSVVCAVAAYVPAQGDMNPFAYDLSASLNQETRLLTVNYKLNAPASSVTVRIFNGNIEEKTLVLSDPADRRTGAHTVSVDVSNCSTNANLTWRVDVEGIAHSEAKFVNNSNKLYYPTSIDIDNNPENANFGTVFCIEGRQDGEAGYISSINNDHAGLYVFNADGTKRCLPRKSIDGFGLEGVNDVERYGWNGGKTHTLKTETDANGNTITENVTFNQNNFYFGDNKTTRGFSPYRVRVSDDGRIFITSLTPSGDVLYEADKNVFSDKTGDYWEKRYWYRVISKYENDGKTLNSVLHQRTSSSDQLGSCKCGGQYCHIYNLYNKQTGDFVAGPNVGFDVRGKDANLQLLMLSGCKQAIVNYTPSRYYCCEYDLGNSQVWNTKPSDLYEFAHVLTHNTAQVQYDKNGNVWMCQYRENAGSTVTLMRYNVSTREIDYQKTRSFLRCGAIRFNNDFTKLAVATRLGANGSGGAITIYDLDQNGLPIGDGVEFIVGDKIGVTMMDFAWDYANNLYIAADYASTSVPDAYKGKGRCIGIYAMPNTGENIVSTPAKTGFRIECLSGTNYSITANSNNIEWGTVNMTCSESLVSGKVPSCAKVTVSATPTEHHRFVEWKVGDQTVSTSPTYSFYATKDLTITAHFASARHNVTWNNLFMQGKDIGTDNANYPNINERLWRMFQARYESHSSKYDAYTSISDYNLDNRKYVRTDNLFLVDLNNNELVTASKDIQNFLTDDETFGWLKEYILSNNPGQRIGTDKAYVYHLFGFFNRTNKIYFNTTTPIAESAYKFQADYEELGKPEHWAPIWTEEVLGLPQTMAYGEYTPISWKCEENYNKCLFRGRWVDGWNTNIDNTGECIIQRPDAWYTTYKVANIGNPLTDLTHILAWRKGGVEGEIVTIIDGDMALYATYVEKNIDEYDADDNPANYDAKNNDVIKLLLNPNYYDGSHDLTISRQLQGGMYNTICLPFDVDLNSLANNHPFKGATAMQFSGVNSLYNESNEPVTVLQFTEVIRLEKGVPYLILTQNDVLGKTSFSGITYNTITPDVQQVTPIGSPFTFHGTINPTEVPEGSLIVVANNRLALTTETGEMLGMRGYFSIDPAYASEIAEQAADGRVVFSVKRPLATSVIIAPESETQNAPEVRKLMQDGKIYILRGEEVYSILGARVK